MAKSQNGYAAYNDTSHFVKVVCLGFTYWAADENVADIFDHLVLSFDQTVEALDLKSCWSWADRNIRGSDTEVSNHASATALDFNATKHPRSASGTFSSTQVKAIRKILADLPVLRWGGDYVNAPKDEMHFEINASKAAVSALAAKLKADDDVPLSAKDIEAIWNWDGIPNENGPASNPNWSPKSMLSDIENTQDTHTTKINALTDSVAQILAIVKALK